MGVTDLAALAMARLIENLPPVWGSAIGAALGSAYVQQARLRGQLWPKRIRENVRRITGETNPARLDRLTIRNIANAGRTTAEVALLPALEPHLTFQGLHHVTALDGPAIVVFPHLGNWECAALPLLNAGRPLTVLYAPPQNKVVHRLAIKAREALAARAPGCEFIPAAPSAARALFNAARRGRDLWIAIDEERDGFIWNPPFGRRLPMRGDRLLAARLARRFGHTLLPISVIRQCGIACDVVVHPPIEMPRTGDLEADVHQAADRISAFFEDLIAQHLEQWYWLAELRLDRPFPPHLYGDDAPASPPPADLAGDSSGDLRT